MLVVCRRRGNGVRWAEQLTLTPEVPSAASQGVRLWENDHYWRLAAYSGDKHRLVQVIAACGVQRFHSPASYLGMSGRVGAQWDRAALWGGALGPGRHVRILSKVDAYLSDHPSWPACWSRKRPKLLSRSSRGTVRCRPHLPSALPCPVHAPGGPGLDVCLSPVSPSATLLWLSSARWPPWAAVVPNAHSQSQEKGGGSPGACGEPIPEEVCIM